MQADILGYLSPAGSNPLAVAGLTKEDLDFMHLTAASPSLQSTSDILNGTKACSGVDQFRQSIERQSKLLIIGESDDLYSKKFASKIGVILGLQQAPIDSSPKTLTDLYDHGIRVVGLSSYGTDQPFGSNYSEPEGHLTKAGKQFLVDCTSTGLIVDLSGTGHQTAREAIDFRNSEALGLPIFASHTGVYELFDGLRNNINNYRNLPWDVLESITDISGIVGICAVTFALSEKDQSLFPFVQHVEKATNKLGRCAVALGTDSMYRQRRTKQGLVSWSPPYIANEGESTPNGPEIPTDIAAISKMDVIRDRVGPRIHHSYIENVLGQNAFNFFQYALKF